MALYADDTWADNTMAETHWKDAVAMADAKLATLLQVATEQCKEFAPALAVDAVVPVRYQIAVVYQAREVYAASTRGENDVIGVGDYAIRARPLTASVKQLLRPERRMPVVA